ncbi:MAG: hypothetical protein AB1791_01565 [Chloroflexota bacterium]
MKARNFTLIVLNIAAGLLFLAWQATAIQAKAQPITAQTQRTRWATPAAAGAGNVQLIGQVGGSSFGLAAIGDSIYLGVGPRLVIMDASDPARPAVVGQSAVLPGVVNDVAVSGDYAYVIEDGGLHVLDISDAAAVAEVGSLNKPYGKYIEVAGDYAYFTAGGQGLHVIDVSDPTLPVEVGLLDLSAYLSRLVVVGNTVYLVGEYGWPYPNTGLHVVDVSNPAVPFLNGVVYLDTITGLAVSGDYAYATSYESGVHVINVANPNAPVETGVVDTPGVAYDAAVDGDSLYVADGLGGLIVISIADPGAPAPVASAPTSVEAVDVAVAEGQAYVTHYRGGLQVVDVADPNAPVTAGFMATFGVAWAVTAAADTVYATGQSDLSLFNVTNAAEPVLISTVELPALTGGLATAGDLVYVADGEAGLRIVDASNQAYPVIVGALNTAGSANDVAVLGDTAYLADGSDGLRIIDTADETAPVEVGYLDTAGEAQAVAVVGDTAYVADGSGGLRVVDVADPGAPVELGAYEVALSNFRSVAVAGDYAYVMDWRNSLLRIVDVSDPAVPVEVSTFATFGYEVATRNNTVYVAGGAEGGLRVIDVSDPTRPVEVGSYDSPGAAFGAAVSGNYVFLADEGGGLFIFWFAPQVTASIPITGGELGSAADSTTYVFPSDTFTATVNVAHTPRFPGDAPAAGDLIPIDHTFEVTAVYAGSGRPAEPAPGRTYTVTVTYSDEERGAVIENSLALYYWDGSQWLLEPTSQLDPVANSVTATPGHFSWWGVFGTTHRRYMPVVRRP